MADGVRVEVPADAYASGHLPHVCVRTGAPTLEHQLHVVKSRIGAQWLLLLVGLVPFVLVRALTTNRVIGALPVNQGEEERRRSTAREATRVARTKLAVASLSWAAVLGALSFIVLVVITAATNQSPQTVSVNVAAWYEVGPVTYAPADGTASTATWEINVFAITMYTVLATAGWFLVALAMKSRRFRRSQLTEVGGICQPKLSLDRGGLLLRIDRAHPDFAAAIARADSSQPPAHPEPLLHPPHESMTLGGAPSWWSPSTSPSAGTHLPPPVSPPPSHPYP